MCCFCCCLFVVDFWLLFVDCCSLLVGCWLLCVVYCPMFAMRCSLLVASCLLCVLFARCACCFAFLSLLFVFWLMRSLSSLFVVGWCLLFTCC